MKKKKHPITTNYKKISDPVVWPEVYRKIKKYKPFVNFDQQKVKKLVVDKFAV